MSKIKENFLRYEFKYILNKKLRNEIESELLYFMQLDPFVEQFEDKYYFVRSLYFDDPAYSFYYEKTDGLLKRQKFRIRTYSDKFNSDVPIMLELKGRDNNFVYKHRMPLKFNQEIFNDLSKFLNSLNQNHHSLAKQFTYDHYRKKIKPIMLIDYKRRAYQSKYDFEFRITFDKELCGTNTSKLFPKNKLLRRKLVDGYSVMEIKFRKHVPSWFHRIMIKYQLQRVPISKYCKGMERSNLITVLD